MGLAAAGVAAAGAAGGYLAAQGKTTKQSQSQTNTLNPWSQQQYGTVSGQVNNTLGGNYSGSYKPYGGDLTAGQTGLQQDANQLGLLNVGAGQGYVSQAGQGASAGAAYAPQTVTPQMLASTNLQPYMNPFQQNVIDTTMNQLDLQRQRDINNQSTPFTMAGAFGGSRQGVSDALTNEEYGKLAAQTLAGLNNQNFTQAQQAAQGDIANNLTAQQANQGAGLQGAGLNLSAAGLLGNLGAEQQQLGLNDVNELAGLGGVQQATNQNYLTNLYNEFLRGQISPTQQAQLQLGLLGETPMLTNSTGTSETHYSDPSQILGGLSSGLKLGSTLFSDERTKENVATIGKDHKGRRWVEFSYRNDPTRHVGVIAQEVQRTDPDAVVEHPMLGLLMVHYDKLKEAA